MAIVSVWVKWDGTRQDDVLDFHGDALEALDVVAGLRRQGFGAWEPRLHMHGRPAILDWDKVAACTIEGLAKAHWDASIREAQSRARPV